MAENGVREETVLFQGDQANGYWFGTAFVFK
jgi:hypothetical protein